MWITDVIKLFDKYVKGIRRAFLICFLGMVLIFVCYAMAETNDAVTASASSSDASMDWMRYVNMVLLAVIGYFLREGIIALKGFYATAIEMSASTRITEFKVNEIAVDVKDIKIIQQDHEKRLNERDKKRP
jgi:hypothetical protein